VKKLQGEESLRSFESNDALLEVRGVTKSFGELVAVNNVTFKVDKGEILGIAGPNGAGKTTLFNCITSIPYKADSGNIIFQGKDITKTAPYEICRLGVARTFQKPEVFRTFTIEQNVEVGYLFGAKKKIDNYNERIYEILEYVGLYDKKDEQADDLSLYEIKMLMLASALATEPILLMLDEPVGGLNKSEISRMLSKIEDLSNQGITIIIVEHIMTFLMTCSRKMIVMDAGKVIAEGTCQMVAENEEVEKVYFGTKIV